MPTPTKGPRLGGSASHERLMLANLATSLFEHGRITTTEAKAKRLRPLAERLITKAKKGELHHRREVMKTIRDKDVVHKLFAEIGPFYEDRPGGYTRIIKAMPRKGDNAAMAVISLVNEKTATAEAEAARGTKFAKDQVQQGQPEQAQPEQAQPEQTQPEQTEVESAESESAEAESAGAESAASEQAESAEGEEQQS